MKKISILVILILISIFYMTFANSSSDRLQDVTVVGLQRNNILKNFTIYSYPEEEPLTNENFKGKITILNFSATWCPYCLQEKKQQEIFIKENPELLKKINLVPIMMDSKQDIDKYLEKHKFSMKIYQDKNTQVGDDFFIRATPTTIIIDENGRILERHTGVADYDLVKKYLNNLGVK